MSRAQSDQSAQASNALVITVAKLDGECHDFHMLKDSTWGELREEVFKHFVYEGVRLMDFEDYFGESRHLELVTLQAGGKVFRADDEQILSNIGITSAMEMTLILGDAESLSQKLQKEKTEKEEEELWGGEEMEDDIGTFGDHDDSAGIALLREPSTFVAFPPTHHESLQIIAHANGVPGAKFQSITNKVVLQAEHRKLLMNILDECCGDHKDFKLNISHDDLNRFLGVEHVRILAEIFPGGDYNEIKLRRCCEWGKCINFHTDYALRTMQIPLNDDDTYSGGRLVYLNSDGFHVPPRPAGSVTIHDNSIVHGVTLLETGVHYGLFLLKIP